MPSNTKLNPFKPDVLEDRGYSTHPGGRYIVPTGNGHMAACL